MKSEPSGPAAFGHGDAPLRVLIRDVQSEAGGEDADRLLQVRDHVFLAGAQADARDAAFAAGGRLGEPRVVDDALLRDGEADAAALGIEVGERRDLPRFAVEEKDLPRGTVAEAGDEDEPVRQDHELPEARMGDRGRRELGDEAQSLVRVPRVDPIVSHRDEELPALLAPEQAVGPFRQRQTEIARRRRRVRRSCSRGRRRGRAATCEEERRGSRDDQEPEGAIPRAAHAPAKPLSMRPGQCC